MKIIALWGPSGAGKTRLRTTDEDLRQLPCVDLGDVVRELKQYPELDNFRDLMTGFVRRIATLHADPVVVEAHFLPGSPSRAVFAEWAATAGHTIEWREVSAPYAERRARLIRCIEDGDASARDRLSALERDRAVYGV